jgi:hypothetical protein
MADINIHDNRENPIQTMIGIFLAVAAVLVLFGLAPGVLIASIINLTTKLTIGVLWAITILGSILTLIVCKSIFKDWKKTLTRYAIVAVSVGVLLIVFALSNSNKFAGKTLAVMFGEEQEPDITKIESDLIGKKIPCWNFDYLSEFKDFQILNQTVGTDRIELDAKLKLLDEKTKEIVEPTVRIIYTKSGSSWGFTNIELRNITYMNPAPVDKWITVYMLPNCSYNVDCGDHKIWLYVPCTDKKFKLGGNDAEQLQALCDSVQIMSREDKPVEVNFNYSENTNTTNENN